MCFPVCAACSLWRHGQGSVLSGESTFVRKKVKTRTEERGAYTLLLKSFPTNRRGGLSAVRTELRSDTLSSDLILIVRYNLEHFWLAPFPSLGGPADLPKTENKHGTRFETIHVLVKELQCATQRLHAPP